MGGSISALDFEHKVARKDFTLVQKLKDPQLGDVSQMKNKNTGKFVLMKEKEIKNIQTFNELVKKFTNRSKLTHRNLMPIYGFASGDSNEIFTTTNKVYVYFEYLPNNLNQAIKSRRRPFAAASQLDAQKHQHKAQMFEESELFGLMLQLVDVLEYLQQNDVNHGDIRPETCFISDEGIIKLVDRRCICEEVSAYTQVKGGNKKVFVTPVQLAGLKKGGLEQQESKYKADVFSLGMTLLECATLKSSSKLYNWTEFKIDTEALEARLEEVKERYSANLYNILSKMLILEERSRPDFIDLNKILNGEDIIKSTAGSPRASTIGDDVHNPCDVLAMTPKLMSVLPQTPNTCQAILIQNSFAHRPVPLPKNSKLSLKVIPKDEELQQTKEAAVQTTSSKITPKPVEKSVKNNNPKQFPARLKKVFEPTVRDPTPKQSSTNDVSLMSSKRNTRTNASHLYKGLLLDNIEPHKLPTNTSGLLSECRGTAVSYTFDSFTSRPSNFEQENHMLDKTMTHRTTNSLSRQSLENFTPKQLTGLTDHFHITKSTSVLPTYSQTPNSTYVYKSGYSNPFIPLESNSATSSRPLSLKSPNLPSYQSINDSRDSNNTSGFSNPIFSKSASVKEFPAVTSRLETSHSMANLSTTRHHKEVLSEREQLLVEDILQKVLNSSGIKTTSNADLKPASKFPLESISMIASNTAAQANTDRYLTERKENLRDLYLSHRTNNSIDCNSSYSRGGLNGFGMKDNYQSSSQGYSSSFYNTDQNTFLADRLVSLSTNVSENRGDKKTIFNREPVKITPNLYSVEADKSFGEFRQVTAGTPKMTDYVSVNDQAPRMSKLNGRSKSNNFVQARFFDKSLWSKNPFKDDYK